MKYDLETRVLMEPASAAPERGPPSGHKTQAIRLEVRQCTGSSHTRSPSFSGIQRKDKRFKYRTSYT
jgi:hypothetical protein